MANLPKRKAKDDLQSNIFSLTEEEPEAETSASASPLLIDTDADKSKTGNPQAEKPISDARLNTKRVPTNKSFVGTKKPPLETTGTHKRDYSKVKRNPMKGDLHLRPDQQTLDDLRAYCIETGSNMSDVFDRAVRNYLDQV